MPTKSKSKTRSAPAPASVNSVSETVLADMLDVTDRRVRQLVGEGIAIKSGPAEYDLGATVRALARVRAAKSDRRITVAKAFAAFTEALNDAKQAQAANRDPLATLEMDFIMLLQNN